MLRHVAQLAADLSDQFGPDAHREAVRRVDAAIAEGRYKEANHMLLVVAALEQSAQDPDILKKRRYSDAGGTPRQ